MKIFLSIIKEKEKLSSSSSSSHPSFTSSSSSSSLSSSLTIIQQLLSALHTSTPTPTNTNTTTFMTTNTSLDNNKMKKFNKETILQLFNQVDSMTPTGIGNGAPATTTTTGGGSGGGGSTSLDQKKQINPKLLFHSNRNILWTILSYYSDHKSCSSIPTGEKKFHHGIISERGIIKLLREWGVIPTILSFQICQQIISERAQEILETSSSTSAPPSASAPPSVPSTLRPSASAPPPSVPSTLRPSPSAPATAPVTAPSSRHPPSPSTSVPSPHGPLPSPSPSPSSSSFNGFFSYYQFCRILLFLSAELIKKPESPALSALLSLSSLSSLSSSSSGVPIGTPGHDFISSFLLRPVMSIREVDAIYLNPITMPMIGTGLRWLFTIMDRSDGRNKFISLRNTVVIPSFQGVLGSQLHIHTTPSSHSTSSSTSSPSSTITPKGKSSSSISSSLASQRRLYRLANIKTGPMSHDVQALVKRNESILVSMSLRYSGKDYRGSYYGRIEIPSTPRGHENYASHGSMSGSMKGAGVGDGHDPVVNADAAPAVTVDEETEVHDQQEQEQEQKEKEKEREEQREDTETTEWNSEEDHPVSCEKNKYHLSSPRVRASIMKRDQMRKEAVGLGFDGLWNLMNDFGVCPEHCSKSTLREICEVAMTDSPFPRDDGLYGYEDFIEILNLIAQNSYNTRSEFGTPEDRMSNLFSSMNKSGGRQRLVDVDRNALVIPPLYLSLRDSSSSSPSRSLSRGRSGGSVVMFHHSGTTSFGSTTSRRSLTPPSTARRSKTPPPTPTPTPFATGGSGGGRSGGGGGVGLGSSRAKTPPATKRSSLQSTTTRSRTPPATASRNGSFPDSEKPNSRPVSFDGRRQSVPASLGSRRMALVWGGGGGESQQRNSRIPMLASSSLVVTGTGTGLDTPSPPSKLQSAAAAASPGVPGTPQSPSPSSHPSPSASPVDLSSHRLSFGRRSGIPQRANHSLACATPSPMRTAGSGSANRK